MSKLAAIETFARSFPSLRFVFWYRDCIRSLFLCVTRFVTKFVSSCFKAAIFIVNYVFDKLYQASQYTISLVNRQRPNRHASDNHTGVGYNQLVELETKPAKESQNRIIFKRLFTYQFSLVLASILYFFVYYVIFKRHTLLNAILAVILFVVYLAIIDNSHELRSIIMLSLPIMFTNRGRALIICSMLAILVQGPVKNSQYNISELQLSLNCCKQYLVIKTENYVNENIVQKVLTVERIIRKFVDNIKQIVDVIKAQLDEIARIALQLADKLEQVFKKLKELLNLCYVKQEEAYENCQNSFKTTYNDCLKFTKSLDFLCELVKPYSAGCDFILASEVLCSFPAAIADFLDRTVGERIRRYKKKIKDEFYVDIDIEHEYDYNSTNSKPYGEVVQEIRHDIKRKFWYISFIARVFSFVNLVLVIWILTTATLYQMHYIEELGYDNMYIDSKLDDIDQHRVERYARKKKRDKKIARRKQAQIIELNDNNKKDNDPDQIPITGIDINANDDEEEFVSVDLGSYDSSPTESTFKVDDEVGTKFLLPLPTSQQRKYFQSFSLYMNETEKQKICIAGLVWTVFMIYIGFQVTFDYLIFKVIGLITELIDEIFFKSDLPLIDVQYSNSNEHIAINRTYLKYLREKYFNGTKPSANSTIDKLPGFVRNTSIVRMYSFLIKSVKEDIPNDVVLLDSLQQCLPKPNKPDYDVYYKLLYLAIVTLTTVFIEAYALRTRHCIADLFYPLRAKKRSVWLYYKLLREKPKYEILDKQNSDKKIDKDELMHKAALMLANHARR